MSYCDWCHDEVDDALLVKQGEDMVCKKCIDLMEKSICRCCGETYISGVEGLCLACAQVESARKAKRRSEILMGVDWELIKDCVSDTEFTEEDYERWVTFGQGNFSPEIRRKNRREWIVKRLTQTNEYAVELVRSNLDDIESLLDEHFSSILRNKIRIIIRNGSSKSVRGLKIIARKGNVFIVEA